jgi:hypothetical protein
VPTKAEPKAYPHVLGETELEIKMHPLVREAGALPHIALSSLDFGQHKKHPLFEVASFTRRFG